MTGIARHIDRGNDLLGRGVAVMVVGMVLLQMLLVILQAVFSVNRVWLQEALLYMNAILFMGAAGFGLVHEGHVRVDIFYRGMGRRGRALVDIGGVVLLLWPLCALLWITGVPYAIESWSRLEGSIEPSGIPGVYILKSLIVLMTLSLSLQGLAMVLRGLATLKAEPR